MTRLRTMLVVVLVAACMPCGLHAYANEADANGAFATVLKCPNAQLGEERWQSQYDALWAEYAKRLQEARQLIQAVMDDCYQAAKNAGNLDDSLFWQAAKKEFLETGSLKEGRTPDNLQSAVKDARKSLDSYAEVLKQQYAALIRSMTQSGCLEQALGLRTEITSLIPAELPSNEEVEEFLKDKVCDSPIVDGQSSLWCFARQRPEKKKRVVFGFLQNGLPLLDESGAEIGCYIIFSDVIMVFLSSDTAALKDLSIDSFHSEASFVGNAKLGHTERSIKARYPLDRQLQSYIGRGISWKGTIRMREPPSVKPGLDEHALREYAGVEVNKPTWRCPNSTMTADALQADYDKMWREYATTVDEATKDLTATMKDLLRAAEEKGDLDLSLFWQEKAKRFADQGEASWRISESTWCKWFEPDSYPVGLQAEVEKCGRAYGSARENLRKGYKAVEAVLTKADKLDEAIVMRTESGTVLSTSSRGLNRRTLCISWHDPSTGARGQMYCTLSDKLPTTPEIRKFSERNLVVHGLSGEEIGSYSVKDGFISMVVPSVGIFGLSAIGNEIKENLLAFEGQLMRADKKMALALATPVVMAGSAKVASGNGDGKKSLSDLINEKPSGGKQKTKPKPAVPKQDPVVGHWKWFNGDVYEVLPDGRIKDRPDVSWRQTDPVARRYLFSWGNGQFLDDLVLTPDGNRLQGKNQNGGDVGGQRFK